jgi:hypothetical protein
VEDKVRVHLHVSVGVCAMKEGEGARLVTSMCVGSTCRSMSDKKFDCGR